MIDSAGRLAAALDGRYRLERELGEGGMARVYLAQDVRHDRRVALKVLRPELAAVVGAERFLAEIKTTANLQHPHILPLFDSGELDGFLFYVMPYVEGETLEGRLERERQLPVEEAVRIALGVAAALQYAHEQGVVHRDIKPANILLSRGEPLVADFGIALAVSQAGSGRFTETGLSLGTPHYMSPEQAAGDRAVDLRSDIYALGSVLFEMLVGEPPYPAPTPQAVLAKILTEEPKRITRVRRTVPGNVEAAVAKALEKLPADRFASAGAFAGALQDPGFRHGVEGSGTAAADAHAPASRRSPRRLWVAGWAASVLAAASVAFFVAAPDADSATPGLPVVRFTHELPEGVEFPSSPLPLVAIAPDGSSIVYVANSQLYLRRLGEVEAHPIAGSQETTSLSTPVFSPDGKWIAYFAAPPGNARGRFGQLKKVPFEGGTPVVLSEETERPEGASWTREGTILFGQPQGVVRVSENGGALEVVAEVDSTEAVFGAQLLPDGEHVLFTVAKRGMSNWDQAKVSVQSIRTGERTELASGTDPRFVATGHVLYVNESVLMAFGFDDRKLEITSPPVPVAEGLSRLAGNGSEAANYALSENGILVHLLDAEGDNSGILTWVDRAGRPTPIDGLPRWFYASPRLSPDQTRIAVRADGDVWVYDLARGGGGLRLTRDGESTRPIWSPDGKRVAYTSEHEPFQAVFVQASDGSGERVRITEENGNTHTDDWSADDSTLLLHVHRGSIDMGVVEVADSVRKARFLLDNDEYGEDSPVFSPDGKWIAYTSDEAGVRQVFITSYPIPTGRFPVSTTGGTQPIWAKNGELFFRSVDGFKMMSSRITTTPSLRFDAPRELFDASFARLVTTGSAPHADFDVTADGQRLLMIARDSAALDRRPQIRIVVNWLDELVAKVP